MARRGGLHGFPKIIACVGTTLPESSLQQCNQMPGVWLPTLSTAEILIFAPRRQVQDQIHRQVHVPRDFWNVLEGSMFESPNACSPTQGLAWNQSHELLEITALGTEDGLY